MKRSFFIVSFLVVLLISSCELFDYSTENSDIYSIGDTGPAGGTIFYVNTLPNLGWTYMEVAPFSWNGGTNDQPSIWGGYGYSVGTTERSIGSGASNTAAIVSTYGVSEPNTGATEYAARVCNDLVSGGYSDWFLPSSDELDQIYENLYVTGLRTFYFINYWSSSENDASFAMENVFRDNAENSRTKNYYNYILPVRTF